MKTKILVSAAVVILSLAVLLAACGGGGGGGGTNPVPPVDAGSPETSAQIQAARDALDGTGLNLPISGAFVTYVKPLIGSDVAGFFLQSQQGGPALFVAVDPAMLNPAPAPGDKVNLVITDMGTASLLRQATGITEYSRISQGATVTTLVQDVNAVTDLVSSLSSYESELLTTAATITSAFSAAGTSFVAAQIDTAGITGNADMKLRMPSALHTALTASYDLMQGCNVSLTGTPLWRYLTVAQLSAWTDEDIIVNSCPAPAVVSAGSMTSTTVRVTFSRAIAASSITNAATQFTFDNGLTASSAVVAGRVVDVTTSAQSPGQSYTVTVAGTVTDVLGAGVNAAANTAGFAGYDPASQAALVINEVDYDNVGTDLNEFVEIYNTSGSAVDLTGYRLSLVNGATPVEYLSVDLSSAGTLAAGEYLVVSSGTVTVAAGAKVVTFAGSQDQIQNGAPDGIALVHSPTETLVDALSYEGSITSVLVTGITGSVSLVEGTATSVSDNNITAGSLSRCPNGNDTNDANSDWLFVDTQTPGAANSCATTPVITVSIGPISVTVDQGGTQQFTAAVSNATNTAVIWSSTCGDVSSAGLFTAPTTPGTCSVTTTSVQDTTKYATATVTVPAVSITISPTDAVINAGSHIQFTATVNGTVNKSVTWAATCGTITAAGYYTAPNTAADVDCSVKVASVADNTKDAAAFVTVIGSSPIPL